MESKREPEMRFWMTLYGKNIDLAGIEDLLIDRRDKVINICEMKYSSDEYEMDKSYDGDLRNKIKRFRDLNNCRKSIQLTMITTYGVKKNKYSNIVGNQVVLDDLFC